MAFACYAPPACFATQFHCLKLLPRLSFLSGGLYIALHPWPRLQSLCFDPFLSFLGRYKGFLVYLLAHALASGLLALKAGGQPQRFFPSRCADGWHLMLVLMRWRRLTCCGG